MLYSPDETRDRAAAAGGGVGVHASNSEVLRDALRLWEQKQELRELEMNRLKRAYDEGMASGEGRSVDAETLLAELKAESRG